MELRRIVRVVNDQGLHARPCHAVVSTALEFRSDVRVVHGDVRVNGKSILELMSLNACCGTELELTVAGEDAEACLERLVSLFSSGFGEAAKH